MPLWNPYVFAAGIVIAVGLAIYSIYNESPPTYENTYRHSSNSSFKYNEEYDPDADKYAKKRREEKANSKDCVVCMTDLKSQRNKKLSCNHTFHERCITQWLENYSRRCPLCKKVVESM